MSCLSIKCFSHFQLATSCVLKVFGHIGAYSRGSPATTFIEQLEGDTSLSRQDFACHGQQTEMGQTCKISAGASQ